MTIRKRSIDTACSNLTELFQMIECRAGNDMYIASMKQLIVNPLAYLQTERMVKADEAVKTSHNSDYAVAQKVLAEYHKVTDLKEAIMPFSEWVAMRLNSEKQNCA